MKATGLLTIYIAVLLTGSACVTEDWSEEELPPDALDAPAFVDGPADGVVITPGSSRAAAVLALVNRPLTSIAEVDDFRVLLDARIHSTPVDAIIEHRLGPDEVPGGPVVDDQLFPDLETLDEIPYIGPVAMARLFGIAEAEGLYQPDAPLVDCPVVGRRMTDRLVWDSPAHLIEIEQSGCTRVPYDVQISGVLLPEHANLEPLHNIVEVDGLHLYFLNHLETARGLRNLERAKWLTVHGRSLPSLTGLEGLQHVETALAIWNVPSLAGLENLQTVGSVFVDDAQDTRALRGLTRVEDLELRGNTDRAGFDNLEEVTGKLVIKNYEPHTAPAFPALRSVGNLAVTGRDLDGIHGFLALAEATGINLEGRMLTTGRAFASLKSVRWLKLRQRWDVSPSAVGLDGFDALEWAESITIETRAPADLRGFDSLEVIDGRLDLHDVDDLENFSDFPRLSSIGGDLVVPHRMSRDTVNQFIASLEYFTGRIEYR